MIYGFDVEISKFNRRFCLHDVRLRIFKRQRFDPSGGEALFSVKITHKITPFRGDYSTDAPRGARPGQAGNRAGIP